MIDTNTQEKLIEHYKQFIGMFVVIERQNAKKAIGILKSVTPDCKLFVEGDFMSWTIDPLVITDFSAREDRRKNNRGDSHD